ncbi:hypothetical protein GCM10017779_04200 [Streptomyces capillispiralis]|nr:hypothetical protein GCM10017779_04200 [Streptomyces capillispiralis]
MASADRGNREEWTGAGKHARGVNGITARQAISRYPRKKALILPIATDSYA